MAEMIHLVDPDEYRTVCTGQIYIPAVVLGEVNVRLCPLCLHEALTYGGM